MKKKVLLSSVLTIALCLCLIAGSTFALFTTSDDVNVAVTAGKVNLTANYDTESMMTWSLYETVEDEPRYDGLFDNGGTATFVDGEHVVIDRMTPGDIARFKIDVKNNSNVNVQYRVRMISNGVEGVKDLTEALVITAYIDGMIYPVTGVENATIWKFIDANAEINDIWITVNFPNHDVDGSYDNQFQEAKADMTFIVEAVQGNAYEFTYAVGEKDLVDADGFLMEGVFNGEKANINLSEIVAISGTTTLANMTLNSTASWGGALFGLPAPENREENTTLVLANGTTVVAPACAEGAAIGYLRADNETVDTLFVDAGAKLKTAGDGTYAIFMQAMGGTYNLVLNDKGLIDTSAGGTAIRLMGEMDANIYVPSVEVMQHYQSMIVADSEVKITWFVNGGLFNEPHLAPIDPIPNDVPTVFFTPEQ